MIDIKRFCFEMGISQAAFGDKIGVDQSVVSHMIRGTRKLRPDHIDKLTEIYGRDVINTYIRSNDEVTDIFTRPQAKQITGEVIPASVVEEIKAEAIEELKAEESVPIISRGTVTSNINVRKYIRENSDELDSIDPAKLMNNPDVAELVTGASMLPTFAAGDVVFVKFLPDPSQMIDGKMYYFDLKDLPTMIRKVKFDEDNKVRLIAKNPTFADIVIERSTILNIGKVVGMFRNTFGDQYDEIDAVRREKDEMIHQLIAQHGDLVEQNKESIKNITALVAMVTKNK